jgi:hypothetical protein
MPTAVVPMEPPPQRARKTAALGWYCHCVETWCKEGLENGSHPRKNNAVVARASVTFPSDRDGVINYLKGCFQFRTAEDIAVEAARICALKKANLRPRMCSGHVEPKDWLYGSTRNALNDSWKVRKGAVMSKRKGLPPPPGNHKHHGGLGGEPVHWEKIDEPATKKKRTAKEAGIGVLLEGGSDGGNAVNRSPVTTFQSSSSPPTSQGLLSPPASISAREGLSGTCATASPALQRKYRVAKEECDKLFSEGKPVPPHLYRTMADG